VRIGSRTRACIAWSLPGIVFVAFPSAGRAEKPAAQMPAPATTVEGTVVALEPEDVVVDLGASQGAEVGDLVELWRPLKLKHPVTGKPLSDRFQIGRLRLVQVRPSLSLAKPDGALSRPAAPGDVVVMARKASAIASPVTSASASNRSAPPPLPPTPGAPPPAADPEAKELNDLILSLKGTDPATRIAAYEKYVYLKPQGRYVAVLWEEALLLRKMQSAPGSKTATASTDAPSLEPRLVSFTPPQKSITGAPLQLALELDGPYVGAVLNVRRAGDLTYASAPMRASGAGYFVGDVPSLFLTGPSVDYFIEAIARSGLPIPVVGSASEPMTTLIETVTPLASPPNTLVTASIWTDYASFNAKRANDYVWQTEGFVGVRLADEGLRAVRSGFGVYRGEGGTLRELDELGLSSRSVGLTYGYLEAEYAFTPIFSTVLRAIIGLREGGVNGGAQGFVRIGHDRRTNLLFGGEVLGGIGLRGITQLEWNTFRRVPILLRTEVTNQPAGAAVTSGDAAVGPPTQSLGQGEIGVRAITQVGYRLTPGFIVAGRFSYQGRTINHAGPGAGAAVTYEW
jgi:hypothetical protein